MRVLGSAFIIIFVCATLLAADNQSEYKKSDSEIWNEGVDCYRSGDVSNALIKLRPLMLSRSHGARAAEVVAKLEYDSAHEPGAQDVLTRLEESSIAAQIALRANPNDSRLKRNFSLSVSNLPELRERHRIEKALEASKNTSPQQLLKNAVVDSRRLIAALPEISIALTNDADKAVLMADDSSEKASKLSDVWLSVKEAVCQAVTNENDVADISLKVDELRKKNDEAAKQISDVDMACRYPLADIEDGFTFFYKSFVLPPEAINESIYNQSNACMNVDAECGRSWQHEALDYTRAFRAKFPSWAKSYEQAAQADTNKPPFSVENQDKISSLATMLEKFQLECLEKNNSEIKNKALDTAIEISKLLPKDKNSNNSNNNQNQEQNQNNNDQNKSENNKDNQSQNSEDQSQSNDEENSGNDKEKRDDSQNEVKKDAEDKEIESVLKRAQERSDEHEAEKKARMRRVRLPPNERDW